MFLKKIEQICYSIAFSKLDRVPVGDVDFGCTETFLSSVCNAMVILFSHILSDVPWYIVDSHFLVTCGIPFLGRL